MCRGLRAVEGSGAHGTEAGGHRGSGLEVGSAEDSSDPCPGSLVAPDPQELLTQPHPSPKRDPAPAPPHALQFLQLSGAERAPGSDCPFSQALWCAHRQSGRREGLSFSKGAAREGEVLPILGRSQGGGRRAGWGPRGSREGPGSPRPAWGLPGAQGA